MEDNEIESIKGQDGDVIHVESSAGEILLSIWKTGAHCTVWINRDQALKVMDCLNQALAKQAAYFEKKKKVVA